VAASRISERVGQSDLGESVTRCCVTCLLPEHPLHYSTAVHIYQADSQAGWQQVRTIRKRVKGSKR